MQIDSQAGEKVTLSIFVARRNEFAAPAYT